MISLVVLKFCFDTLQAQYIRPISDFIQAIILHLIIYE